MSNECSNRFGLIDGEAWFRGGVRTPAALLSEQVSSESLLEAERLLKTILLDAEFQELLPYILEEHGSGSRASVMKDPTTAAARGAKRENGVFYSPSDVAEYMVQHTRQLHRGDFLTARCLDPACGTGVFLLALLRTAAHHQGCAPNFSPLGYVASCLHGLDVSGHALDAAAFLLLKECFPEVLARGLSPQAAWHSIRLNLVEADALCVGPPRNGEIRSSVDSFANPSQHLADLFPQAPRGFDIVVGNPPYTKLGERPDFDSLTARFASLKGAQVGRRVNLFPLFVEMMWQFTKPGCNAAALVTPLSVAFHRGLQYESCRQAMGWNGGRWQFAFFDREPHGLFGEEVKTRNAILFRSENAETPKRGQAANIETGPLRKWTSRTRPSLFQRINFTVLGSVEITTGISKLGGDSQAKVFMTLRRRLDRLPTLTLRIGTCEPAEALTGDSAPRVFVGGTAYNFLNVYRPTSLLPAERNVPVSESSVHCLEFRNQADAGAAFAILSSRLVFWLWHVLGDGFHVGSWLLKTIPFGRDSFTTDEFSSLSLLGDALWLKVQNHRFISLNGGKQTIGFRSLACHEERDGIDSILSRAAGLDNRFATELRRFVQQNAVVDSTDERRNHVKLHFTESLK